MQKHHTISQAVQTCALL